MNFLTDLFQSITSAGLPIALITAIPFVLVALVFLFLIVRSGSKVRASRDWRVAQGRVLASYIERRVSSSGTGGRTSAYYPVVAYEYEVGRQEHRNSRIRFGSEVGFGWTAPAQKAVDRYPVGSPVSVYYDPNAPENSVLERTASTSNRLFLVIVIVILGSVLCTLAVTFGGFALVQQILNGLGLDRLIGGAAGK